MARTGSMRRTVGGATGGFFGRESTRDSCRPPRCALGREAHEERGDVGLVPPPTPSQKAGGGHEASEGGYPRTSVGAHTMENHGKGSGNQDSHINSASISGTKSLIGVFDGHGHDGGLVSDFACAQIARSLFSHKELHTNPASAIEGAFFETQQKIEQVTSRAGHQFDATHSGTTAIAAYRHRNRLFIANVGDSRAVLGYSQSGRSSSSEGLVALELSSDQRPDREDERRRILAIEGAAVHQSAVQVRQSFGAPPRLMRVGPDRVWDRAGRCGLCVTRSLGDLGMRPFVIPVPEVSERELGPGDKLVILGSDGVWDRVGSQEAVDIAARHRDPNIAAREIANVARQRWHAQTQGQMSDDITAVVMHIEYESPPPTRASSASVGGILALSATAGSGFGRRGRPGRDDGPRRESEPPTLSRESPTERRRLDGTSGRLIGATATPTRQEGPLHAEHAASRGAGGGDRLPPMATGSSGGVGARPGAGRRLRRPA